MKLKNVNEELKIVPGVFINSTTFLDSEGNKVPLMKTNLYDLAQDNDEDQDKLYSTDDLANKDELDSWFDKSDLDREIHPDGLERSGDSGEALNNEAPKNPVDQFNKPTFIDDATGKQFYYSNGDLIEI